MPHGKISLNNCLAISVCDIAVKASHKELLQPRGDTWGVGIDAEIEHKLFTMECAMHFPGFRRGLATSSASASIREGPNFRIRLSLDGTHGLQTLYDEIIDVGTCEFGVTFTVAHQPGPVPSRVTCTERRLVIFRIVENYVRRNTGRYRCLLENEVTAILRRLLDPRWRRITSEHK